MKHEQYSPHYYGPHHGTIVSYAAGFVVSLMLTVSSFALVTYYLSGQNPMSRETLILAILGLGFVQLCVQLVCFLHLGREQRPRWNVLVFSYAVTLLILLVVGTLWIMKNLNDNMKMSPAEMDAYMLDQ